LIVTALELASYLRIGMIERSNHQFNLCVVSSMGYDEEGRTHTLTELPKLISGTYIGFVGPTIVLRVIGGTNI
jgi:hypothetical protein